MQTLLTSPTKTLLHDIPSPHTLYITLETKFFSLLLLLRVSISRELSSNSPFNFCAIVTFSLVFFKLTLGFVNNTRVWNLKKEIGKEIKETESPECENPFQRINVKIV